VQCTPKRTSVRFALLVRIATVTPTGQVTDPCSRSIVNSALLKKSFFAGADTAGATSSNPEARSAILVLAMGVRDHLGNSKRVGLDQLGEYLANASVALEACCRGNQIGVDIGGRWALNPS